eukprot:TRINITY_DN54252_c0_g1_i1.p1 TRINITY_DN54252_c0_g1~~TRINITY_DN54252_c0_g1_i1.p1  ORF type:complete len:707 (+),score=228.77 TRINITY_DN54252_c0_g1_i1:80-2200(+)
MASKMASGALAVCLVQASALSVDQQGSAVAAVAAAANPIRKVVTMLQAMQKKVTEEGEKEEELYKKFMCYCKTNGGALQESISSAGIKAPALEDEIKAAAAQKVQLDEDLKQHQADRSAAKAAAAEATALREKEAKAYAGEKAEYDANIEAIAKAVGALEHGMAGGFLQTPTAKVLKRMVFAKQDMDDDSRNQLLSFLSGSAASDYSPKSGEITGILKELGEDMKKSLAELTAAEKDAITNFEELKAAKTAEVAALTSSIESKSQRTGEVGVSIARMKGELSDTEEALMEDKAFLAELEKGCDSKSAEWDERVKTRADELTALAETIKILNDDDALDLFKKTLPSASASLVQLDTNVREKRQRALQRLEAVRLSSIAASPRLDLITLALQGKKIGFEKVIKMIDDMVNILKQEQVDDDNKKDYCGKQLDEKDDKRKALEQSVSDSGAAIEDAKGLLEAAKEDIKNLQAGMAALDKSVAEASEQRKAEHLEFVELMASDKSAKELLNFAKNRLHKFYNPKMHKAAPKTEDAAEFVQVARHGLQHREAPPPPPETFGAYESKSQETTGVISMIDLLIKDLDKEMTEAETQENDSQKEYERLMKDAAEKRAQDSKTLTARGGAKAQLEEQMQTHKDAKSSASRELAEVGEFIATLHSECDWLLQYYGARKEARNSEIGALGDAKAVLHGADFSLLQTHTGSGFLNRGGA